MEETDNAEPESIDQIGNKGQNNKDDTGKLCNTGKTTQKKDASKPKRGRRTILSEQMKDKEGLESEEQTVQNVRRGKRKLKR